MKRPEREQIVKYFLNDISKVEEQFIKRLRRLILSELSDAELFTLINEYNFYQDVRALGYDSAVQRLLDNYDKEIIAISELAAKGGTDLSRVNYEQLEQIMRLDGKWHLRRAEDYTDQFKSALLKAVVTGESRRDIQARLLPEIQETVKFRPTWLTAAVDTAFSNFGAATLKKVFEDEPNQKFVLLHPRDENNREACKIAIALQDKNPDGFTIKQINGGALGAEYTFEKRGGFNCRGEWVPAD